MDPLRLLDILDAHLSDEEMSVLCRQFGVAFDAFSGESKRDNAREFMGFVQRRGRMEGLTEAIVALRPDLTESVAALYAGKDQELSWLDQGAGGTGQSLDSGLTWRWAISSAGRQPPASVDTGSSGTPEHGDAPLPDLPVNPYTPGARVADELMFFGREIETEQTMALLADGRHVAAVGHRGFGASSFLAHVSRAAGAASGALVAYIDLKDPAHYTPAGLFNAIWTQWWERVRPGNSVAVRSLAEFVTAVRKLNAAGFRPALFLDELEQLTWRPGVFDDAFFAAFNELGREGLVTYATTAHSSPADVMAQAELKSDFFDLFQTVNVGLLDEKAARDLLVVPIRRAGLNVPDGAEEYLYLHAGPHPFFLHLAGLYFFEALAGDNYSRGEVIRRFDIAAEPFWQELWDSLSPLAQSHYPAGPTGMAVGTGMGSRQLRKLANRGLVIADEGKFRPFSEGFARWLARLQAALEAAAAVTATPL